jgi:hypothetical protein
MSHDERPDAHLNTLTTEDVKIVSSWGASSRRFHSRITIASLGLRARSEWAEAPLMARRRGLCRSAFCCPVKRRSGGRHRRSGGRPCRGKVCYRERANDGGVAEEGPTEPSFLRVVVGFPHIGERQAGRLKTITSAPSLSTRADTNCQPSRWRCATMSVADRLASPCRAALGTSTIP